MKPAKEGHRPKRWLVWVLSIFLSFGAGHFYAGERQRAVRWFGLRLSALFSVVLSLYFGAGRPGLLIGCILLYSASYVAELMSLRRVPGGARPRVATSLTAAFGFAAIAAPLSTAILVREFVLEAFRTPSGSMLPNIFMRDHFFVRKTAPRSVRGDVVVFEYPDPVSGNPRVQYVKRVIGVPGDRLEFVDGHPILNGWLVPSCLVATIPLPGSTETTPGELHVEFLEGSAYLTWFEHSEGTRRQGPYTVAEGELFVVGDNRWASSDSRSWRDGSGAGVPFENVAGRAAFVWLGFDETGAIAWNRIGLDLTGPPKVPTLPADIAEKVERCLADSPYATPPASMRTL